MKSSAVVGLDQAADAVAAPVVSAAIADVQLSQPFAAPKPDAPVASSAAGVSIGSTFDIVIHYGGDPAYQAAFDAAAARWEQIITGEIPDVNSGIFGLVDDLLIDASVVAIDGPGHVLAQAGPDYFRSGSSLPYHGVMQFDSADMAQMAANGTLTSVILHEMGHVLGIGTIWTSLGLASGYSYTGAHALAEYRTLTGNPGATSVPLESGGGPGTAGGHWSESVFNAELMTGYVETGGTAMPLSRVTIGALQDMGYAVNYGAADPFSLPPSTDDYADNLGDGSAPFGALATAGSATGNIEWTGDHDWFRIELTAGAAYTITLQGAGAGAGTLQDPYLRVYDGSGHLIAFDDDSDGNLCSRVVVAPANSGTYYVDASGYSDQCAGTYTVRVSGAAAIGGTSASDFLNGTDGSDTIAGLAGSDTVSGLGGSDFLYGNQDNDSLDAGSGENTVWAGQGDDYVTAQDGSDFLWGCEGADTLLGANGYNTIVGGSGAVDGGDLIAAGVGSDLIWGNGGNDTVAAGDGANTVIGGFGSDTLAAGPGNDVIFGNQDNDTIDAGDGANVILAGLGDDRIVSGSGNDTLYGNEGNDVMTGGTGADRYVFAAGSGFDQINGFTVFEGDRVDLQGQTFTQGTSGDGDLLLTLSGGGAIEFNGVNPTSFSLGFIA